MKNLFTAGLLISSLSLLGSLVTCAQSAAPSFPTTGNTTNAASPAAPLDAARARRQQQMSPEDAAHDQQLQILEARTGNTSFGAGTSGPSRQYDKRNGAFTVRRYKGMPGQEQKRGVGRPSYGINPKGQPLVHDHKQKKKLLFF